MFTGIVQGQFELGCVDLSAEDDGQIGVSLPPGLRKGLKQGDSSAIEGTWG